MVTKMPFDAKEDGDGRGAFFFFFAFPVEMNDYYSDG